MGRLETIAVKRYKIEDALDFEVVLDEKTLREELVQLAASTLGVEIPDEARDIWFGEVEVKGNVFEVTLYYDKDAVDRSEAA